MKAKFFSLLKRALLKSFLIAFLAAGGLFVVYFFNLDMKLTALMEPILYKFYDRVNRDQHL